VQSWKEKEGFSLGHWHEEFKRNVLLNLVELSKTSQDRRQPLLLKVSVVDSPVMGSRMLH
jgi:hypothetical protein